MNEMIFNRKSMRSEKSRIAVLFSKILIAILSIVAALLLITGIYLIISDISIGWVIIGLTAVPAMIVEWYNGELKNIAPSDKPRSIDDALSSDILGRLSRRPTPREVAMIASSVLGGQFFAVRFGISAGFLQDITSINDVDIQTIWREAWSIYKLTGSKNISAPIIIVAIIKTASNSQSLLGHLQLDIDDLVCGVKWYDRLVNLIDNSELPHGTGGFARDWSFGWTPLLNRFGTNISHKNKSSLAVTVQENAVSQLINVFSKKGHQNAVLVGSDGVGKTCAVHAFALKLMDASSKISNGLKFRQIFALDASSLIASAAGRGELEQLVPRILTEAYRAKNIIICLDNAQLFFEDGIGSVDISNVLLPILEAGNLRVILSMNEQQYLKLGNRHPQIINSLNRINIAPTSQAETIAIMQDQTIIIEFQNGVTYMYQALAEAYRLGDRYIHDLVMPGKALKLLESAVNYSENGLVTAKSVQQVIEETLDIKVGVVTDGDEREKLLNLENLIHTRMINQSRAVKVVSDALRRARAGIRNQNRPIGTFLFLGPTGVGKTELAKALAAIYYGDENRIIRLDMNEYSSSEDVSRLIADGANNATSLTAKVMKQPFSVVLLDEIEKAHVNVLSTLLQMLDEGILRNVDNHEVSFRDAIIIATSNAGADRIREYIDRGHDIEKFEDQLVDELISSNQFRPEFLNRFDEIVMFKPLTKDELLQVVDLIIASINKTLSLQKISVNVSDDAKKYLVEAGYDPRLGARPMRRVVQRAVENTVAKQMLSGTVEPGSAVEINLDQVQQIINSKVAAEQIINNVR
jgi:ATP-dependent Clp protease ATP-binding subunit ClpC